MATNPTNPYAPNYTPNYAPTYAGSTANRAIVPGSAYFPGAVLPKFDKPEEPIEEDWTAAQNKPQWQPYQAPYNPMTDPTAMYQKMQSDTTYKRQTQAPDYQMGQYQVGQASRTPQQKGTDLGVVLKSLQESSGLPLLGSASGARAGSTVTGLGAGGGGGIPATVQMPDTSAARAAAFGRAKDVAGQQSQAAIKALRENMAGRGLLGSGIESAGTAQMLGQTAAGLSDVGREQAIRDAQAAEQRAQMMYGGGITQRGQDIGAMGEQARLAESARQADAARQAQMMQGLLGALNIGGLVY